MEFYYHDVQGDVMVVSADGGIDSQTSRQFVDEVCNLVQSGMSKLIVDCAQLTYVSSYGLGVLLRLHKHAKKAGGEVKLTGLGGPLVKVLNVTRLDRIFGIYKDVDDALAAFGKDA
ncbi:MAG: STAS domain-containing protein [Planctomycetota bacterium]|jgi:anti-sigma B factor antagonist